MQWGGPGHDLWPLWGLRMSTELPAGSNKLPCHSKCLVKAGWHVTPWTQHTRVNIIFTSHDLCTIISIKASAALHSGTERISSKTALLQRKPEEMVKPSLLSKLLRKYENIQCRLKMEELLSLFTAYCVSNMEVQNKLSIQHKSKC